MKGILGRKLGMTQVFDPDTGAMTAVTVIEAGPCPVVQVKSAEADGYDAVQLAFGAVAERKLSKPELGHLVKAGAGPHRHLVEFRGASGLAVGETVTVDVFEPGDRIKVSGVSIGKGYQGTIKRHGFTRGPVTHGSHNIRKPGSIGASAFPSRVFKGMRMSGRMGGTRVTQPGLVVHDVDAERNLLLVKGSVPGPKSGLVEVRSASRPGARTPRALLPPRLRAAARDQAAALRAARARARSVQLGADRLVDQMRTELDPEHGCLERHLLGLRSADDGGLGRGRAHALRISSNPLFGPGTEPLTMRRLRSTSTSWTTRPGWVTRVPPMRPDMRIPLKTREGVAEAPIDPGFRMLWEPWETGPRVNPWRLIVPW